MRRSKLRLYKMGAAVEERRNRVHLPGKAGTGRARFHRLRKNSDLRGFGERHDFSRALRSLIMSSRFSAPCFLRSSIEEFREHGNAVAPTGPPETFSDREGADTQLASVRPGEEPMPLWLAARCGWGSPASRLPGESIPAVACRRAGGLPFPATIRSFAPFLHG
jgi:hypothetical protein